VIDVRAFRLSFLLVLTGWLDRREREVITHPAWRRSDLCASGGKRSRRRARDRRLYVAGGKFEQLAMAFARFGVDEAARWA